MAARVEGISSNVQSHGRQMEQMHSHMLTSEHFKVFEDRFAQLEAGFKAMQTELRALSAALEKKV